MEAKTKSDWVKFFVVPQLATWDLDESNPWLVNKLLSCSLVQDFGLVFAEAQPILVQEKWTTSKLESLFSACSNPASQKCRKQLNNLPSWKQPKVLPSHQDKFSLALPHIQVARAFSLEWDDEKWWEFANLPTRTSPEATKQTKCLLQWFFVLHAFRFRIKSLWDDHCEVTTVPLPQANACDQASLTILREYFWMRMKSSWEMVRIC